MKRQGTVVSSEYTGTPPVIASLPKAGVATEGRSE